MTHLAVAAQHHTTGGVSQARPLSDPGTDEVGVRKTAGEVIPLPSPAVVFLELPLPPSTNNLYQNRKGKGRAETAQYRDWKGHAGWRLREQRPASLHGPVVIVLNAERANSQADIDNRVKALFDLLVAHKVIDDDRHVVGFAAAWAPSGNGLVRVAVIPAGNISIDFQLATVRGAGGWFIPASQSEQEIA